MWWFRTKNILKQSDLINRVAQKVDYEYIKGIKSLDFSKILKNALIFSCRQKDKIYMERDRR